MERNYSQDISRLEIIKDEELRHEVVFYILQIADLSARIKYEEHFIPQRQMAWKKALDLSISEEFEKIIKILPKKRDYEKMLLQIKDKKDKLEKKKHILEQGIYEDMRFFEEKGIQKKIGGELEKVLRDSGDIDRIIYCLSSGRDYLER